jgi:hypothetical protein
VVACWDKFEDWVNADVVGSVRRIDISLAVGGIGSVGYYSWAYGWQGAISSAMLFALMLMTGLFMRDHH